MKTIEQMIASGASWDEIKQRVEQIQGEQKAKEEKKAAAKAKIMQVDAAKERLAVAFVDYMAAEGLPVGEVDRAEMIKQIKEVVDELSSQVHQAIVIDKLMNFFK